MRSLMKEYAGLGETKSKKTTRKGESINGNIKYEMERRKYYLHLLRIIFKLLFSVSSYNIRGPVLSSIVACSITKSLTSFINTWDNTNELLDYRYFSLLLV